MYPLAADLITVVHATYVGFVVFGQIAIVLGLVFRWTWVRHVWFRVTHFAMIAVVVVEALLGITCPLTTWEFQLRMLAGQVASERSFVATLVHKFLFVEGPPWVFTLAYCSFGLFVLGTLWIAPPKWNRPVDD